MLVGEYARVNWKTLEARINEFQTKPPATPEEEAEADRCAAMCDSFGHFFLVLSGFTRGALQALQQEAAYGQYLYDNHLANKARDANP
jgi:hypothetical protein